MNTSVPSQDQAVRANATEMPDEFFFRVKEKELLGLVYAQVELRKYRNAKRKRSILISLASVMRSENVSSMASYLWKKYLSETENTRAIRRACGDYPPKKWGAR
jgi:membrane-anchored protein YejM (alkaline phosphatase superfamily)